MYGSKPLSNGHPPRLLVTEVLPFTEGPPLRLPLVLWRVSAGFPSPADDYVDRTLDLNELVVKHPAATFFLRVEGDSMTGAGIYDGDLLVVDRALEPTDGKVVIAALDGELTVKRVRREGKRLFLVAENDIYPPLEITEEVDLVLWGVVTHVLHDVK